MTLKLFKNLTRLMLLPCMLLCAVSCSDSETGDGDYFRRGAFEETVDGQRMVFIPVSEGSNDVLFTWDRINQNYIVNDMTSTTKLYSGNITVPATVTHDGVTYNVTGVDDYAFIYCTKLTGITVSEGVRTWGKDELVRSTNITTFSLPSTIDNFTEVPYGYFAKFGKLKTVQLPNVTAIGDSAFASCLYLSDINIPEGCTSLGRYAFSRCSRMTKLTLPSTITSIGEKCFASCTKLKALHVKAVTPPSMAEPLPTADAATLYIPQGSYNAYANDAVWGQFSEIVEE